MGSGLLRHVRALAHDWGQVLMFEGKSCSHFRSFTTWISVCLTMQSCLLRCDCSRCKRLVW